MASTRSNRPGTRSGQASVEFVAVLPALAICLMLAGQAVAAGWALWSAGNAARAGARAEHVVVVVEIAAGEERPSPLGCGAEVGSGDGVRVKVRDPALVPGV